MRRYSCRERNAKDPVSSLQLKRNDLFSWCTMSIKNESKELSGLFPLITIYHNHEQRGSRIDDDDDGNSNFNKSASLGASVNLASTPALAGRSGNRTSRLSNEEATTYPAMDFPEPYLLLAPSPGSYSPTIWNLIKRIQSSRLSGHAWTYCHDDDGSYLSLANLRLLLPMEWMFIAALSTM